MRILVFVCLPLLLLACSTAEMGPWDQRDNSKAAYKQVQQYMNERLLNSETAKYPTLGWNDKVQVTREGETQYYRVIGYVDTEDAFGETLRTEFQADVEMVGDDDWVLLELLIL